MWDGLAQATFSGLASGWIYVLIALGLALVFSIMRILMFAHGEIYMLGAYVIYYVSVKGGINFFWALMISALTLGVVGVFIEKLIFRRIRGQMEPAILAAIGLTLVFQTTAVIAFGSYNKFIPAILPGVLFLWGVRLAWDRILIVFIGVALTAALFLVIRKTKVGQAMLAISQDPEAAALQGINVDEISSFSMGVGCALAAIAGGLMGSLLNLTPQMGTLAITKGIAVIVLGGIGSISGAIVGGLILGLVDGIVPLYADSTIAAIAGFCVIIIILLIKPKGLLGHD
jgi:branched-chain amino acid transport system permease protein